MTMARVNSSLTVRGSGCSTITHGSAGNTIAEYRYDGLHRRISKAIAGGDTFHYYYNENWQVLEVTKGSAAYEQYVWDARYIDAPVLRWRDANNSEVDGLEETLFYTNDANMNVTALVNESGQVVERYRYDAYGKVTFLAGAKDLAGNPTAEWTVRNASIADNQVLYCGYRFDPETGLYQVRHRMLHPTAGRWMQRDPMRYVDGANLVEYGRSSPVNAVDPRGTISWYGGSCVAVGGGPALAALRPTLPVCNNLNANQQVTITTPALTCAWAGPAGVPPWSLTPINPIARGIARQNWNKSCVCTRWGRTRTVSETYRCTGVWVPDGLNPGDAWPPGAISPPPPEFILPPPPRDRRPGEIIGTGTRAYTWVFVSSDDKCDSTL